MPSKFLRGALLAVPAFLMAACGGGGGDSAPGPGVSAVSQLLITNANASSAAADGLLQTTNFGAAYAGVGLVTAAQVDAGAAGANTLRLAAVARKLITLVPDGPALVTGATVTNTFACTSGGSMTVTETSSGGAGMVAGDAVTISTSNCVETVNGVVVRMNGTMAISITSGSYDAGSAYPRSVGMRIDAQNFSITESGITSYSHGVLDISLIENSATDSSVALNSSSLVNSISNGSVTYSVTLKSYFHRVDATSLTTTVEMSSTVETNNSRLGSGSTVSYQVSTPTAIVLNEFGDFVQGSLKVVGRSSALLLTVTSVNAFSLQVDTDGNGTYESNTALTLAQLQAAL